MKKIFDGKTELNIQREPDEFIVYLTSAQIKREGEELIEQSAQLKLLTGEIFEAELHYELGNQNQSLQELIGSASTQVERLQLALQCRHLRENQTDYRIPFIHPENIFYKNGMLTIIHSGIKDILAPKEISKDLFFAQYKALILSIFHPEQRFESFLGGDNLPKDNLSAKISSISSFDELDALLEEAYSQEKSKIGNSIMQIPKRRYQILVGLGIVTTLATIILGIMTFVTYQSVVPKANAVNTAQTDFINRNYGQVLTDLNQYQPSQLSKSARYVLAASSVNLTSLSKDQQSSILGTLSTTTDDNTLNYWIYEGRGEFEKALNLAQNIGDNQLILLTYTDLYSTTKIDQNMDGTTKQSKLDDYSKKISDLEKQLGK